MGTSVRPPEYILRKAWLLGRKMAYKERRIGIDLTFCYQFPSYELFRTTNRARVQNLPAIAIWEERLQSLVQRAATGLGFSTDNSRQWSAIDQLLTRPIRNAFWTGWEQAVDLHGLYLDVVRAHKAERSRPAVHVNPHPGAASPASPHTADAPGPPVTQSTAQRPAGKPATLLYPEVEEESRLWDQVARIIFDDLAIGDDDAFWAATGTETESDHTGDESLENLPRVFGAIRPLPPEAETQADAERSGGAAQPGTPDDNLRMSA